MLKSYDENDDKVIDSDIQQSDVYAINIHEKGRYILVDSIKSTFDFIKMSNSVNKEGTTINQSRVLTSHIPVGIGSFQQICF